MALKVETTSKRFSIKLNDFWKGLIVATLTTPLTLIYTNLGTSTPFAINWQAEGAVALIGLIGYLLKNFGSGPQTTITGVPAPGQTTTVTIPPKEAGSNVKPTIRETPAN